MKHIFRVPVDTKHFEDTIVKGKSYDEVAQWLDGLEDDLGLVECDNGKVRYWGSLPGKSNTRLFRQMQVGDELLCYRSGKYVAHAIIGYITENPPLARFSWGETKQKTTWELMYFFRDIKLIDVKATVISQALGYKKGSTSGLVRGFSMVEEKTANRFLAMHGSVASFLQKLAA